MPLHVNVAVKVVTVVSTSCVLLQQLNHRHHQRGIIVQQQQQQQQQRQQHQGNSCQRHSQGEQPVMEQHTTDWSAAMPGHGLYSHLATVTATATVAYDTAAAHMHTDVTVPACQQLTSVVLERPSTSAATSNSAAMNRECQETVTALTSPATQATSFSSSSSSETADSSTEAEPPLHGSEHSLYFGTPPCVYQNSNNYTGYVSSTYLPGDMNCEDTSRCFPLAGDSGYGRGGDHQTMVNDVVNNLGDNVGGHFSDNRHHEEGQHPQGNGSYSFDTGAGFPMEAMYPSEHRGWQEQFACYPQSRRDVVRLGYGDQHGDRASGDQAGEAYGGTGGTAGHCDTLAATAHDYMMPASLAPNAPPNSFPLQYSSETFYPNLQEASPFCALRLPDEGPMYNMQPGFQASNRPFDGHLGHESNWYETDTDEWHDRASYPARTNAFLDNQGQSTVENKDPASLGPETGKHNDFLKCQKRQSFSSTARNNSQEPAAASVSDRESKQLAAEREQCGNTQHPAGFKDKNINQNPDTGSPLFSSHSSNTSKTTSTHQPQLASSSQSSSQLIGMTSSTSSTFQSTTMPEPAKMVEQQQNQACRHLRTLVQEFPDQFSHIPGATSGSSGLQTEKENIGTVRIPYQTDCRHQDPVPMSASPCPGKFLSKPKVAGSAFSFMEPGVSRVTSATTPAHSESDMGVTPTLAVAQTVPIKGGVTKAPNQSHPMKGVVSATRTQTLPIKCITSTTPTQSLPMKVVASTAPPSASLKGVAASSSAPTTHPVPIRGVAPSSTATPSLPMQCDPQHLHPSPIAPLLTSGTSGDTKCVKTYAGDVMSTDDLPVSPVSSVTPPIDVDHLLSTGVTVAGFKPRPIIRKRRKVMIPLTQKDVDYWRKRKKNNDSAKRSREAKKEKEKNFYRRALELEYENYFLKERLAHAEAQLHALTGISPAPHEYGGPASHDYVAGNAQSSDAVFM